MKQITIKFNNWREPGTVSEPEPKTITFFNDGEFTTNDATDQKIPMRQDDFIKIINVYLGMPDTEEISRVE